MGGVRDGITRRGCQADLEAIFHSVKDGIITIAPDFRVLAMNEAACALCKYPADAVGRDFRTLTHAPRDRCLAALMDTIKDREAREITRIECRCPHRVGGVVTLTTAPLIDENNSFGGAVLVVRDETRLASLERDLKERLQYHQLFGKNERMQRLYQLMDDLAEFQTTVLITGESGTGKELVADALHYHGPRSGRPLVKVNCAALPETLLESELFGHVRGAFTGAVRDKVGRFERANGGTIFLDEIGDISPRMQLRLLRVLQVQEFERVGDSTPIKVDVRVVAATNQDLEQKVRDGAFREDLYYRLNVVELQIPPLRERRDDMPLLTAHFIDTFNKKFGKRITGVSDEVRKIFMQYRWPGNVRELEHAIEHAFIVCRQSTITADDLPVSLNECPCRKTAALKADTAETPALIRDALERTAWNKASAAKLLGISRRTMYRKMAQYRIGTTRDGPPPTS